MRDADRQTDTVDQMGEKKENRLTQGGRGEGKTRQAEPQSMDGGGIVSISPKVDKVKRGKKRREGEEESEVSKKTRECEGGQQEKVG